jgi:hypothetical protein
MCIRNNFLWYASKYLMTVRWLLNGPSWSWWYVSWIYNYLLCNQCLPPIKLWVRTRSWRGVLDTTLCDKVCKWLATGLWFPPVTPVSSTNKTDRHEITEILLKVTVNTISHPNSYINENYQTLEIQLSRGEGWHPINLYNLDTFLVCSSFTSWYLDNMLAVYS